MQHNFTDVDRIVRLPQVEVACEVGGTDMVRVSPSEPIHALIFAAAKAVSEVTAGSQKPVEVWGGHLQMEKDSAELAHDDPGHCWRICTLLRLSAVKDRCYG